MVSYQKDTPMLLSLKSVSVVTLSFVAALIVSPPVRAVAFTEIVAFGDSLSDTGNVFTATANTFPASPPYFNGRFSNGPVWLEILAARLGLPAPAPSLLGGTNNSFGGAETPLSGLSVRGTPNIGVQVATYLAAHPTLAPNQLIAIWGGSNDFLHFPVLPLPDPAAVVSNLAIEITQLASAGGKSFIVPNLAALGETPYVRQQLAPVFPNIEATVNALALQTNLLLATTEDALEASLGIDIIRVDVASMFNDLLLNPSAFGLTNLTDQAKSGPTGFPGAVVPNPNQYVWWDDVHPTATIHRVVGERAADAVRGFLAVPEPPISALIAIALLVTIAGRRRVNMAGTNDTTYEAALTA
jgi:phospholipase/lecithinase/hemolysin